MIEESITTEKIKQGVKSKSYQVFYSGIKGKITFSGTGIIIENTLQPRFKRISDRISTASVKIDNNHYANIIVAYAPTLTRSEDEPQLREEFYNQLDKLSTKHKKNKHVLIVLGDFNAKTGSGHKQYPNNMGKYGKGHINSNGEHLLSKRKKTTLS